MQLTSHNLLNAFHVWYRPITYAGMSLAHTAREFALADPRVSDTLGWILCRRGLYDRALNLLKESASKLPDNPQVQYYLSMVYAQLGDRDNARTALTAAVNSPATFHSKEEVQTTL